MIIDSLQYSGACSCGASHEMKTRLCVVESGCLKNIANYLAEYGIRGYTVAVYDENTYRATADRHPAVDFEVVLDPTDLHANEHGVALLMERLPKEAKVLIAVGSGTIHDITRYCAYTEGLEFVSCPTAASVDGFCSSVAAMTWHGCKKTLTAVAPKLVIADIEIIKHAPMRLTRSGFGDMIGKYIALTDWKVAHIITGEAYCKRIADMTLDATKAVLAAVEGIKNGTDEAYASLTYGLLLSGLAMQMIGTSRPASGAEHHVSHMIEMAPPPLAISSTALHGEKVGVGTLLMMARYQALAKAETPTFVDYTPFDKDFFLSLFGETMTDELQKENAKDSAAGITAQRLQECWPAIRAELSALPDAKELTAIYTSFGVLSTLAEIEVDEKHADTLVAYSHLVRNRLTLARLAKCIKV